MCIEITRSEFDCKYNSCTSIIPFSSLTYSTGISAKKEKKVGNNYAHCIYFSIIVKPILLGWEMHGHSVETFVKGNSER